MTKFTMAMPACTQKLGQAEATRMVPIMRKLRAHMPQDAAACGTSLREARSTAAPPSTSSAQPEHRGQGAARHAPTERQHEQRS